MGQGKQILDTLSGTPRGHKWEEVSLPAWTELSARAKRYLRRRGVGDELASELGIVEMEDSMRLIVPYYGRSGEVIYWTARAYSDMQDGPKYMAASGRHPLYVLPGWSPASTVVVVEGVFDAIAVYQATGHAVVALGGKALPRYLVDDLAGLVRDNVVVCLDSDATASALKLRSTLSSKYDVKIVQLPVGEDPSSMGDKLKGLL